MDHNGNIVAPYSTEIDRHVGARIQLRRIQIGMSRETFADRLEVTVNLITCYERGYERPPALQLLEMSRLLQTNIAYFFADLRPMDRRP